MVATAWMSADMTFVDPTTPNLADFITFCQAQGVTTTILPADSDYYAWAFDYANDIVTTVPQMPPGLYVMAVYNLGLHHLLTIAQDQPGQTFFADARTQFKLMSFVIGGVQSSSDEATSQTLVAPEFMKNLTYSDIDMQKTPWGRQYLAYAQTWGPTVFGVS